MSHCCDDHDNKIEKESSAGEKPPKNIFKRYLYNLGKKASEKEKLDVNKK